jgi:DNA polymerase-3 subunit delta
VILKSYIIEKDLNILDKYQAVLMYGENEGIKDDVRNELKAKNKNSEIINFFENEIIKNKNILYESINNRSLFSEKKIIFIQFATDKILNEIIESLEKKSVDTKIVIIADNLDRKSKLRTLFEKEKKLAVFACYQDNDRSLIDYINKELAGYKGVTGELVNMMISNSGYNRKIIQNELLKIKNFFLEKIIKKNQLLEILNIKNDIGFDEIRDNALIGRKNKINKLLSETSILNEESFFYINNLNYRVLKLIEIKKMNEVFNNYEQTLEKIKPPIFWKDKSIYLEQLKKWNLEKLNRAADKIGETEVLIRKNSHIKKDIIIKNLIIALSDEASTSS